MKTTKLYQKDVYLKDWDAHITSVQKHSTDEALLYITLDKTAFSLREEVRAVILEF